MKKIFLSLVFAMVSIASFGQLNVYLQEYSTSSSTNWMHFKIENIYSNPVWVMYMKVVDTRLHSTIYYSNETIIINSCDGPANAWDDSYDIYVYPNNNSGSNLWNTTYMVEIQYAEVYDGAKLKTDKFYTNGCIGTKLVTDSTTDINNIKINKTDNKFYDLTGKIVEHPTKGNIYIYNNKKIIY